MEKRIWMLLLFAGFCFSQEPQNDGTTLGIRRNDVTGSTDRRFGSTGNPPRINAPATSSEPSFNSGITSNDIPLVYPPGYLDNYQPQVTSSVLKFIADVQTRSLENAITIQAQLNDLAYSQTPLIPDPRYLDSSKTRFKRQATIDDQSTDDFFNLLTRTTDEPVGVPQPVASNTRAPTSTAGIFEPKNERGSNPFPFSEPNTVRPNGVDDGGINNGGYSFTRPQPVNRPPLNSNVRPSNSPRPTNFPPSRVPLEGFINPRQLNNRPPTNRNYYESYDNAGTAQPNTRPQTYPRFNLIRQSGAGNVAAKDVRPSPPQYRRESSPTPSLSTQEIGEMNTGNKNTDDKPINRTPTLIRIHPRKPPSNLRPKPLAGRNPTSPGTPRNDPQTYNAPPIPPRQSTPTNGEDQQRPMPVGDQIPRVRQSQNRNNYRTNQPQRFPPNAPRRPLSPGFTTPMRAQPPRGIGVNTPATANNPGQSNNPAIQTPVWRLPIHRYGSESAPRNNSRSVPGPTYVPQVMNWSNPQNRQNVQNVREGIRPSLAPSIPNRTPGPDWFDQYNPNAYRPNNRRPRYGNSGDPNYGRYPTYQNNDQYRDNRGQYNRDYNPEYAYRGRYPGRYQPRPTRYPDNLGYSNPYGQTPGFEDRNSRRTYGNPTLRPRVERPYDQTPGFEDRNPRRTYGNPSLRPGMERPYGQIPGFEDRNPRRTYRNPTLRPGMERPYGQTPGFDDRNSRRTYGNPPLRSGVERPYAQRPQPSRQNGPYRAPYTPPQSRPNVPITPYRGFPLGENVLRDQTLGQRGSGDMPESGPIRRPPALRAVAGEEEYDVPYSRVMQGLSRYRNLIPTLRGLNGQDVSDMNEPSYIKALSVIRSFNKGETFVYNGYIVQNFYISGDYELAKEHFRILPNVNVTYLETNTYSGYTGAIQNYRVTLCKECGLGKRYPVIEIVGLNKVYPGVVKRLLYDPSFDPSFDPTLASVTTNPTDGTPTPTV